MVERLQELRFGDVEVAARQLRGVEVADPVEIRRHCLQPVKAGLVVLLKRIAARDVVERRFGKALLEFEGRGRSSFGGFRRRTGEDEHPRQVLVILGSRLDEAVLRLEVVVPVGQAQARRGQVRDHLGRVVQVLVGFDAKADVDADRMQVADGALHIGARS